MIFRAHTFMFCAACSPPFSAQSLCYSLNLRSTITYNSTFYPTTHTLAHTGRGGRGWRGVSVELHRPAQSQWLDLGRLRLPAGLPQRGQLHYSCCLPFVWLRCVVLLRWLSNYFAPTLCSCPNPFHLSYHSQLDCYFFVCLTYCSVHIALFIYSSCFMCWMCGMPWTASASSRCSSTP